MSISAQLHEQLASKSGQDPYTLVTDIAKIGAVRGIEAGKDTPDYHSADAALKAACDAYYIPGGEMYVAGDGFMDTDSDWNNLTEEEQDEAQDKIDEAYDVLYQSVMDETDAVYEDLTQLILNY